MRKLRNNISLALAGMAFMFTGCEKELMNYEGVDALYFDVRRVEISFVDSTHWAHEYFSEAAFGSTTANDITLKCKVMTSGYPKDYDREFAVIANPDSTTAVAGRDYDALKDKYVIKAGETNTIVYVKAHRSAEMEGDTLLLQLKLLENEHFKTMYTNFKDAPQAYPPTDHEKFSQNHDAAYHNIWLYDVMVKPGGWWGGLFKTFTAKKWKLMMEISGTEMSDYDSMTTMPQARAQAINDAVAEYLLENAKSRETVVLEDDGTMMYVSAVGTLGGSRAWSEGTTPDEYYK